MPQFFIASLPKGRSLCCFGETSAGAGWQSIREPGTEGHRCVHTVLLTRGSWQCLETLGCRSTGWAGKWGAEWHVGGRGTKATEYLPVHREPPPCRATQPSHHWDRHPGAYRGGWLQRMKGS